MTDTRQGMMLAGPGIMLISAAIFGYFGFLHFAWNAYTSAGDFLLFIALCEWTLKCSAIGYVVCAGISAVNGVAGNLLYSLVGLAGALLFVAIAVLDFADANNTIAPYAPFMLLLFAAWNGYGSWTGLRSIRAAARRAPEEAGAGGL